MKQLVSLFLCAAILAPCLSGCRKEAVSEQAQEPSVSEEALEQAIAQRALSLCDLAFDGFDAAALGEDGVRFYMHTKRTRLTILKFPRRFFRSGSRRKLGRIAP